jgi:hypothetical protein
VIENSKKQSLMQGFEQGFEPSLSLGLLNETWCCGEGVMKAIVGFDHSVLCE